MALEDDFKKDKVLTAQMAALIFFLQMKQRQGFSWHTLTKTDDASIKLSERSDVKTLAQAALGYGRRMIKENNGIKENSIFLLSALMGRHSDELDSILVAELNQYGRLRGDVAHDSWLRNQRTFESAQIEKNRIESILSLIKMAYESGVTSSRRPRKGFAKTLGYVQNWAQRLRERVWIPIKA